MVQQHLKRLASPKTWPISKKTLTFVTRPLPGPNKKKHHLPITIILRDVIKAVTSTKEVKFVLHNKDCLIDGVVCHNNKQPVGLLSVISLPKVKEAYRLIITSKNKLTTILLKENEANKKTSKIVNKTTIAKGKVQLNLIDGRNILVKKDSYKVGDSLLLEIPSQKIIEHLPLEKGALIFLDGGNHVGKVATVQSLEGKNLVLKYNDILFKTKKEYAIVIGKDKPLISVQ